MPDRESERLGYVEYQDYNERLSPRITRGLAREGFYSLRNAAMHHGLYRMATTDINSIQLTIRPGPRISRQALNLMGVVPIDATGEGNG